MLSPSRVWAQLLASPEGGDDAQQGLIQPDDAFGVVSQDPVVAAEGYQATSSGASALHGKENTGIRDASNMGWARVHRGTRALRITLQKP